MTQTLAIFLDAYRELNSKRLFWITMIISSLVVAAFAIVGINENGLRVLAWDLRLEGVNSKIIPADTFYKTLFISLGIGFWLTWLACILALVSTAGIIPDFVSAGSIDLVLCKPIGRLRLFLTKYATGLFFVGLQVSVFCMASFLVLGIKGALWEPRIFLAIPIVTVFFSYLFCICALLGLLTRSTIASLLLTLLAWFAMFGIGLTENIMLAGLKMMAAEMSELDRRIARNERAVEAVRKESDESNIEARTAGLNELLTTDRAELAKNQKWKGTLDMAHTIAMGVKTLLPKTSETIGLLNRWLIDMPTIPGMVDENGEAISIDLNRGEIENRRRRNQARDEQVGVELEAELRSRPVWWVVGTSLAFEAFVLAIAAWIFCRRDF